MGFITYIRTTSKTQNCDLTKLIEDQDSQVIVMDLTPEGEESFPIPWDSQISILEGEVIMSGSAGGCNFGTCKTTFPTKHFPKSAMAWEIWIPSGGEWMITKLESLGFTIACRAFREL